MSDKALCFADEAMKREPSLSETLASMPDIPSKANMSCCRFSGRNVELIPLARETQQG
jgi:hypothetical protein